MPHDDLDLRLIARGAVTAPAGCGKTELIARTLRRHDGPKPVLVLTHTNAGVAALRARFNRDGIPTQRYRLSTIDGWAMRLIATFPMRSGHAAGILDLETPATDYPAIRAAAVQLMHAGHVSDVVRGSYAHIIVDEYQDCSLPQHTLVCSLADLVPTCVLGDPLQAIFGFRGNVLADWQHHVCAQFPIAVELDIPWRWRNSGAEPLGVWLLDARRLLLTGQAVDLSAAPAPFVTWVQTTPEDEHAQRLVAAQTMSPTPNGRVLILADSHSRPAQQQFASQTPGASTVEAVDLQDLTAFGRQFNLASPVALTQLLTFGQSVMTNLGIAELTRRLNSLRGGRARQPANAAEMAALKFEAAPSWAAAGALLDALHAQPHVRVFRPTILYGALRALREAANGRTLTDAATRVREEGRVLGRVLPQRAVGSTLLLKGLEAEVAVVLNPQAMNAAHLYVAMTRGSMRLVVCSPVAHVG